MENFIHVTCGAQFTEALFRAANKYVRSQTAATTKGQIEASSSLASDFSFLQLRDRLIDRG